MAAESAAQVIKLFDYVLLSYYYYYYYYYLCMVYVQVSFTL